ncbi:MAG: hypothetical protein JWQ79_1244 [Mucilaginibacter sp.]|nr:hypothetical protein [Mucilaginibacter sp.]
MKKKFVLVVSAINFFEGGPISILKDCLSYLNKINNLQEFQIIALIHHEDLFDKEAFSNLKFISFPKSRTSYLFRLYYEYWYFKKFAKNNDVSFWLSLHDMSPRLANVSQAVYCHNPSPFNNINFSDLFIQPTQFFFKLFYKYLYRININSNDYVIVQQNWIKKEFHKIFKLSNDKIIVAIPEVAKIPIEFLNKKVKNTDKCFFFPTYPRPFKNIEIICEAVNILNKERINNFKVLITIDGTENKYSQSILKRFEKEPNLEFVGLLSRQDVYRKYAETDCLIFPSKLETWGLPISEFKQYNKPMLVADLPYAKETVGSYDKAKFFNSKDPRQLASYMKDIITGNELNYEITEPIKYSAPFANGWAELFSILLKEATIKQ